MIRFLSENIVLAIHEDQVRLYGGQHGVRDAAALDAAIHMPQAQFGGQFLHPTIFHMAAAYGFHPSQNHPFLDGNKRTAGMVMFTFLQLNGLEPTASEIDYYIPLKNIPNGIRTKKHPAAWYRQVQKAYHL